MAKTSGRGFIDLERQEQQRSNFVSGERGGQGGRGNAREWSQRESSGASRLDDLASHHQTASFHHETASFHHGRAATHYASGNTGTASLHAQLADTHSQEAQEHGQRARSTGAALERDRREAERDRRSGSERRQGTAGVGAGLDERKEVQGQVTDEDQRAGGPGISAQGSDVSKVEQSNGQEIADADLPSGKGRGSAKN